MASAGSTPSSAPPKATPGSRKPDKPPGTRAPPVRATSQPEELPAPDSPYPEPGAPEPDDEFVSLDCGDNRFMQLKPESMGAAGWFAAGDVSVLGLARDLDGDPGNLRVAIFIRGAWMAQRPSRWRSRTLTASGIEPSDRSGPLKATSVPLTRGAARGRCRLSAAGRLLELAFR
jgi:hypothetical protein